MKKLTAKEKASLIVLEYMSKVVSMELAKECALVAISFARGSLRWNLYPLDAEWTELKEIEKEINNL